MHKGIACSLSDKPSSHLIFINGANSRGARTSRTHQPAAAASQPQPSIPLPKKDPEHTHWPVTFTAFELDNLRLMRHFCSHVWPSIVPEPVDAVRSSDHDLWRDIVPDLALEHPFLLHALLAVSAVHFELIKKTSNFASTSASTSMANLAHHHHALSLPLMRDAMSEPIDETIIPLLFAAAALIAMYAFGHPWTTMNSSDLDLGDQTPIEDFARALTMLHGMSGIVYRGPGFMAETPFKVMLPPAFPDLSVAISLAEGGYIATLKVAHTRISWLGGQEVAEAYRTAIELLLQTFLLHHAEPTSQGSIVPFAVQLPEQVLSGIREQQPLALCLIAGYAAVLHWLRAHLWIQGWGRRVIEGVWKRLRGSEWEEVIAWPLQVVEIP